jgi:uncharacterized coiled-coil protein SlyX
MMGGMDRLPGTPKHPAVGVTQMVAEVERAVGALERLIAAQRETISLLAIQLAARTREVHDLHELLRATQAHALALQRPAPPPRATYEALSVPDRRRPRWRRWLLRVLGE